MSILIYDQEGIVGISELQSVKEPVQITCSNCGSTTTRIDTRPLKNGTRVKHPHWYKDSEGRKICSTCYKINSRSSTRSDRNAKLEVFRHYFGNNFCCQGHKYIKGNECRMNNILVLQLHHAKGGGNKQRIELFGNSHACGGKFYSWLRRNGYPDFGLIPLCANCHMILEAEEREKKALERIAKLNLRDRTCVTGHAKSMGDVVVE